MYIHTYTHTHVHITKCVYIYIYIYTIELYIILSILYGSQQMKGPFVQYVESKIRYGAQRVEKLPLSFVATYTISIVHR